MNKHTLESSLCPYPRFCKPNTPFTFLPFGYPSPSLSRLPSPTHFTCAASVFLGIVLLARGRHCHRRRCLPHSRPFLHSLSVFSNRFWLSARNSDPCSPVVSAHGSFFAARIYFSGSVTSLLLIFNLC